MKKLEPIKFKGWFALGTKDIIQGNFDIKDLVMEDIDILYGDNIYCRLYRFFDKTEIDRIIEDNGKGILFDYFTVNESTLRREYRGFRVDCIFDADHFAKDFNLTSIKRNANIEKLPSVKFTGRFTLEPKDISNILHSGCDIKDLIAANIVNDCENNLFDELYKFLDQTEINDIFDDGGSAVFLDYFTVDESTICFDNNVLEDGNGTGYRVDCTFDTERFIKDFNLTPKKDKAKDNIELD